MDNCILCVPSFYHVSALSGLVVCVFCRAVLRGESKTSQLLQRKVQGGQREEEGPEGGREEGWGDGRWREEQGVF